MSKKRNVIYLGLALTLGIALVLAWVSAGWTASVTPKYLAGASNDGKTCEEVMPGTTELKIEPVPDGTKVYSDTVLSVEIVKPSTLAGETESFDWESNIAVVGVIVKNGDDGANWYDYSPDGSMADTYLTTPGPSEDCPKCSYKEISHISFCYYPTASKSGTKFHDLNADGVKDEGEPGLAGWTIYVDYDDDGILDEGEPSAVTDVDGDYTIIGIVPGTWKVKEVAQTGWTCSFPNPCYHQETFVSGMTYADNNFGNWTTATKSWHQVPRLECRRRQGRGRAWAGGLDHLRRLR
jgi:hypothetical protein